jgi:alpha-glucoside transport system permease protein
MSARISGPFSRLALHLAVISISLVWLMPSVGLLMSSFRRYEAIMTSGWWTVFQHPFDFTQYTLQNYAEVLSKQGMGRAFLNSLIITVPSTVVPILLAAFAAYAFAWMNFRGRNLLFAVVIGLLVVPLQMVLIPMLRIYSKLGLAGTFVGIWLAHSAYGIPFAIYLLRNFFGALPAEIFECTFLDGGSHFAAFRHVALPLSVPALASLTIFQFLWVWNDLLVALIYLGGSATTSPLTLKLNGLVGYQGQNWHLLTAGAFVSMALPLVIFLALQRYFIEGILAGAVKG